MKGLDDYITGKNDPNAPFNQVDWTDRMSDVLDNCDEITEEVYDKEWEFIEVALAETFHDVKQSIAKDRYFMKGEMYKFIRENEYLMTVEFKKRYKILKFWNALHINNTTNPIAFNVMAFEQAKQIGLDEGTMNRIIGIYACTLEKEFPVKYFKTILI